VTAGGLYESHKEACNLCGASNHVNEKEGDFSCNCGAFSVINFPYRMVPRRNYNRQSRLADYKRKTPDRTQASVITIEAPSKNGAVNFGIGEQWNSECA
jgi:hypothetical protein